MADGESRMNIMGQVSMPIRIHDTKFVADLLVTNMNGCDGIWGIDFMSRFQCDLKMTSNTYTFEGHEYPMHGSKHQLLPHSVSLTTSLKLPPGAEVAVTARLNSPFRAREEVMLEPNIHFVQKYNVLPAKSVTYQSRKQCATPVQLFNPLDQEIIIPKGIVVGYAFPAETLSKNETSSCCLTSPCPVLATESADSSAVRLLEELEDDIPEHLMSLYEKSSGDLSAEQKQKLASLLIQYKTTFAASSTELGRTNLVAHEINTGDAKPFRLCLKRHGWAKEREIDAAVDDGLKRGIMEDANSPWASAPVVVSKKDGTSRFCIDFRQLNSITKADSFPIPRFDDCVDSLHGKKFFCTLDLQAGYWQVPLKSESDKEKTAFLTKKGLFQFTVLPFGLCNAPATFERLMENVLRGLQWERCLLYLDDVLIFGETFEETLHNLQKVLERLEHANLKIKPSKCILFQSSVEYLGHRISEKGLQPLGDKIAAIQSWPTLAGVPRQKLRTEVRKFLGLVGYYRRFIRNMSTIAAPLYELTKAKSDLIWTADHEASFQRLKGALITAPVLSFPDLKQGDFILDTDASNTGVGAVLSQRPEDRETVLGYFSRLLSDSERQYCITEREFLGVVKAVQHFKPYLYGRRFLIRTDNSAVSHMLTLTDAQPQIQRWQLFLSQFVFDVVHRPGRKHINADVMSRLPCQQCGRTDEAPSNVSKSYPKGKPRKLQAKENTDIPPCQHTKDTDESIEETVDWLMMDCAAVTTRSQAAIQREQQSIPTDKPPPISILENIITLSEVANIQASDPDIAPILQLKKNGSDYPDYRYISGETLSVKALRQHWRHLLVEDGILFRRLEVQGKPARKQLVLPRTVRYQVLEKLHSDPASGHLGMQKTFERVKARFYWVGWRRDTMRFISHCEPCNVMKHPHKKRRVPLTQQLFGEAFERVSVDIIGPLRQTVRGFSCVLTMEDNFTKWVEAAPLKTMETTEVCNAIIRELISRFGCMYLLHSDRGPQFVSHLYASLLQKLGVNKSLTTPYNPKSNGRVENFNKILKSMMKTYIYDHRESVGDWDSMLPLFLMAYRSSVDNSTGETPHYMLMAREMKVPLDLLYSKPSESEASVPAYIRQLEERFHKAYALARNHLKLAQRVQKKQFEPSDFIYKSIKPGDFVWYFNPRKTFKGDRHLQWRGPYLVQEVASDFTVTIQLDREGGTYRTHADKLRLAHGVTLDNWRPTCK
ncbi:uncharacterized protein LOC135495071 [Lineus longissimus]|uniref:uncharacterized protein LOC135495071 n=1 Tax=Lineus longissimus TaxID=88925 RepID=UPI00315D69BE